MEHCLRHLTCDEFTYPKKEAVPPQFVPKDLRYTARETKLLTLQGSLGPEGSLERVTSSFETTDGSSGSYEEIPIKSNVYPLSKMGDHEEIRELPSIRGMSTKMHQSIPSENEFAAVSQAHKSNVLSAKDMKRMYDLRSSMCNPLNSTIQHVPCPDNKSFSTVQGDYMRQLSERREAQPNFSDIFGSNDSDHLAISARPNRNIMDVRSELLASDGSSYGSSCMKFGPQVDYLPTARSTRLISQPAHESKDIDIFGNNKSRVTVNRFAKVIMLRLTQIPPEISEADIVSGCRKCKCNVSKIWMPSNMITGEHRGVGSVIVRIENSKENLSDENTDRTAGGKSTTDSQSYTKLIQWLKEKKIEAQLEDVMEQ